ncbi:hypothetical protein V4S40_04575 [Enterococcus cecorum]
MWIVDGILVRCCKQLWTLRRVILYQVTVLLGNHDEWFCDWLFEPENAYIGYAMNMGIETIESFFTEHNFQAILNSQGDAPNIHVRLQAIEEKLRENLLNAPENQKLLT